MRQSSHTSMKWPYHLVQPGQISCPQVAHAFDSPRAVSDPQHAHRTGSRPAALRAASLEALAFDEILASLIVVT